MVPKGDEMAVVSARQPTKEPNCYFTSSYKENPAIKRFPDNSSPSVNESGKTVRAVLALMHENNLQTHKQN